jgi:O-antigen/teichoic acid export membrane protein
MNKKSSANTLISNTGWVYAGKIITQIFSLVASVLVIRKLPVDTYGAFTFAFGLYAFFQLFIYSPLQYVAIRFLPEMEANGHTRSIRRFIAGSLAIALVATIALLSLMHIFENTVTGWFNITDFDSYQIPFYVFVIAYSLKLFIETIMVSFLMHRITSLLNIMMFALRSIAYIALLGRLDVALLLEIEYGISLLYFVAATVILLRSNAVKVSNASVTDYQRYTPRIRRFWLLSVFSELGAGLIGRTSDYYIISAMSGSFQVGLYGFAVKIYEIFYKILPVKEFDSVLRPVFFNRYDQNTPDDVIIKFYSFMVKMMMPVFIFPFIYFLIFGKAVIFNIFDPKYIDSYMVTSIILLGIVVNGFFYPLNMVIQLKEQVQINLYSRIVVVFSIAAGIVLMKHYGIIGVAVATLLGEIFKFLSMFFMFRRYMKLIYPLKDTINQLLTIIIPAIVFYPFINWYSSALISVLGSAFFVIFYLLMCINLVRLTSDEKSMIDKLLTSNKKTAWIYRKIEPIIGKLTITTSKSS